MSNEKNLYQREIALWERAKGGDFQSFNEIYRIYYPKLIYIAGQLHCGHEVAKDLIHDTFVEIYERRETITIKSSLKFYLIRCFKSHWYKHIKSTQQHMKVVEEEKNNVGFTFSIQQEIIQEQANREMYAHLEQAINELSARQREAMYYFYKEGLDYDEIGEIMSLKTRRSAQNLIYEAVRIIKTKLLFIVLVQGVLCENDLTKVVELLDVKAAG